MNLQGYDTSFAEIIKVTQEAGAVIGGSTIGGVLGCNPYSLDRVFDKYNISYENVALNDLDKEGTYVVSYWNSSDVDSMLHTVAIQHDGEGNYQTYNISSKYSNSNPKDYIGDGLYIAGYQLISG